MYKSLFSLFLLCCLVLWAVTALADTGVFDVPERPATNLDPWHRKIQPLWQRVLSEEKSSPGITPKAENFGPVDATTWQNLTALAQKSSEIENLRLVNGYFNQWLPKNDLYFWAASEYWAAPKEFLRMRGGDCEDYAIAKYFGLRSLGLDADRMRIVIVRRKDEHGVYAAQLHAVLAVRVRNSWFILDNNARPRNNIFPHTQYQGRFNPLYSMNENGAWVHDSQVETPAKPPVATITK